MMAKRVKDITEGVTDFLGAIASIPILGKIFNIMTDQAGTHLEKKAGELFGLSSKAADKTTVDEALFEKAIVALNPSEKKAIMDYLGWLRKNNPKLAKEFVLWVYNTLVKFECKVKKTLLTGRAKNVKEERTFIDYTDGIAVVGSLFRDIIAAKDEAEKEFVLFQRNIYVEEEKPTPAVEFAKKKFADVTVVGRASRDKAICTMSDWRKRSEAWKNSR
jgi:hypothetical protein